MAAATQKIVLSPSRDIPFDKLVLSQSNVRRVKAGISVEELAEDIARRGSLLQSLNVRPVVDADGKETDRFEVPAGGRRYQALALIVKQKRLARALSESRESQGFPEASALIQDVCWRREPACMAKYLSEDLRVRVIEAVRSGASRRQAAARSA